MNAIDRVMLSYESKHKMTDRQALYVRAELSTFIDGLMSGEVRAKADVEKEQT